MSKQKIVLLAAVSVAALTVVFLVQQVFSVTLGGNLNMGSNNIINIGGIGDVKYEAANKDYVSSSIAASVYWAKSGSNVYPASTTWDVGIGTTNPAGYKFNVAGTAYFNGNVSLADNATVDGVDISVYSPYFINSAGTVGKVWKSKGSGRGGWEDDLTGGGGGFWQQSGTDPNDIYYNTGNVGIGTSVMTSVETLKVVGLVAIEGGLTINIKSGYVVALTGGKVGIGEAAPDARLEVIDDFMVSSSATGDGDRFTVKNNGWIGFGDAAPDAKFDFLNTHQTADSFRVDDELNDITPFIIDKDGNVGVGTTSPTTYLEVRCPLGFTNVKAGNNQLGCIQSSLEGNGGWEMATNDCFNTYGGRLPTTGELYIASANGFITQIGNEWCDDYEDTNRHAISLNQNQNDDGDNGVHGYRCWLPR